MTTTKTTANTMTVDHDLEAQLAADAGHVIDCFEVWAEKALERGVDEHEIYALWIQETTAGRITVELETCYCDQACY